jgi:hypothetical protein
MADLQDDIRRAFRHRLSENPAAPDLRARIAAAVGASQRRRSPSWLPAVAATAGLLVVAGLIIYLMQYRQLTKSQPMTSPPAVVIVPTTSAPAGFAVAFGWDGVNHRVIISSAIHDNKFFGDTWALSGTTWASAPSPVIDRNLTGAVLAYDSRRGREVFAAVSYTATETWEWDGHSWQRRSTAHVPSVNSQNASGAYSPELGATVILDGMTMPPASTWLYDGTDWRSVLTAHQPDAPAHLEYDQARHSIVALSLKDYRTWLFDGKDWTPLPVSGPTPMVSTGAGRQAPWVGLDQAHHAWVVFGGFDGTTSFTDTWTGDGGSWTQLNPPTSPTSRIGVPGLANLAWDPAARRLLLFGGQAAGFGAYLGDTWTWDGVRWSKLAG